MITFDNIRFHTHPTKTGRQLIGVDIHLNSNIYDWKIYIPQGVNLESYLQENAITYELDILQKEELWNNSPHTEIIEDPMVGQIILDIPKERIVCPTIPDELEKQAESLGDIESLIKFYYKFYDPTKPIYETGDWNYPTYSLRIKAPLQLIMDDIGIKIYGWFSINNLPIVNKGDGYVYLYCNEILQEHTTIINSLSGVVIIETKPE